MIQASTPEAFKLMMDGQAAFSDIEQHGMRVDVPYLHRAMDEVTDRIGVVQERLQEFDEFKAWQKKFGPNTDMGKREQLGWLIYDEMGYEVKLRTETGKRSTKAEAFEHVNLPFLQKWNDLESLKHLLSTWLKGCLLYTSPSPRDQRGSRMPSSA